MQVIPIEKSCWQVYLLALAVNVFNLDRHIKKPQTPSQIFRPDPLHSLDEIEWSS